MKTALAMTILLSTFAGFSAVAGPNNTNTPRPTPDVHAQIADRAKWEGMRSDSRVEALNDEIAALNTKKSCTAAANTWDDWKICEAKYRESEAQMRVKETERHKSIDDQEHQAHQQH